MHRDLDTARQGFELKEDECKYWKDKCNEDLEKD